MSEYSEKTAITGLASSPDEEESIGMQSTQTSPNIFTVTSSVSTSESQPYGKRLSWRDIYAEYSPKQSWWKRKKKHPQARIILDQVSGFAESGQLTFIMGSSGAGKTTLLNILTGRNIKMLRVYGEVFINKHAVANGEMKKSSAYVQQEDVFIGELTVREQLIFAASLRMPANTSYEEKIERVNRVSKEMGLNICENAKIGSVFEKSISKGEKKRLSFACEVLTDPPIMFCDEPTSGLDSFMALQVMKSLKTLAAEGKTIVCTIHQPSSQVFQLADRLILMALGRTAYQGAANQVEEFFTGCGYPVGMYISVSDHFMRVLSKPEIEKEDEYADRIQKIIDTFEDSENGKTTHTKTHTLRTSERISRDEEEVDHDIQYPTSWLYQCSILFGRGVKCVLRNPMVLKVRLFQCLGTSLIIGLTYFRMDLNSSTVMNYRGAAFTTIRDMNFMFMFPCAFMPAIVREYHSNMYHPTAYFVGKNLADTLQYIVLPTIYSTLVYWMTGFEYNFVQFLCFWCVSTLIACVGTSVGYALTCIFGSMELALAFLPLMVIPLLTFSGFFIELSSVPDYFKPLIHISWFKYGFEAQMITLFGNVDEIKGCEKNTTTNEMPLGCYGSNGTEILNRIGRTTSDLWWNILVIFGFIVFWRTIAVLAYRSRIRRA